MNFAQELKAIVHAKQHLIKPGVCFGTTRTGQPCKRPACNGEQYCPVHSAHGGRRRRLKRITDVAAPDLFELWCAADREMLLKEHGGTK